MIPIHIGLRRRDNLIASFPLPCPTCRRQTIHVYGEFIEKLTLFFIPILTSVRRPFVQCSECRFVRQVPPDQMGVIRSLTEYAAAPFRICFKCGAHNQPEAVLCRVCNEVLRQTLFPRKGPARIMAILLTLLFALLMMMFCYSFCLETF